MTTISTDVASSFPLSAVVLPVIPGLFNMSGPGKCCQQTAPHRHSQKDPLLFRMSGHRRLPSIQIRTVRYTLTDIGTFSKADSIPVPPYLLFRPVSVNTNQLKYEFSVHKMLQILTRSLNDVILCRHSFFRLRFPHRCVSCASQSSLLEGIREIKTIC